MGVGKILARVRVRVTQLVELVLVFLPSLVSRVDLPGLTASSSKQASKQATASTREMGKYHNSVMVFQIRLKFWWRIPIGVKNNDMKYEGATQQWRPGTGVLSGGRPFQKLQFRAKNSLFLPKPPYTSSKLSKEGKWWLHSTCS